MNVARQRLKINTVNDGITSIIEKDQGRLYESFSL